MSYVTTSSACCQSSKRYSTMVVKTVYIARHGYRSNWLPEGPYPPPPTGVDSDVPLAEHGLKQARELAHFIMSIDNQPEAIFSSPFYRCVQTSEPVANMLQLPVNLERGIGEWYKPDRNVIPEPATFEVLSEFFPGKLGQDWESTIIPSNKGETEEDIFQRCQQFWPAFIEKVESHLPNVETILLVTHAATKIALGMSLLKFDNCRDPIDEDGTYIRSGSCSIDKYELVYNEDDSESNVPNFKDRTWLMTMNGNTEFLTKGEEMNWSFQSALEAGSDADIKAREAKSAAENIPEPHHNIVGKEEHDVVYVSVDIPSNNYRQRTEISRTATLQYSGLETEKPLFRIGDKIYEGGWRKLVGTELAFPSAAEEHAKRDTKETSTAESVESAISQENTPIVIKQEETEATTTKTDNSKHAEKIYHITDRIVLQEVKPM